MTDRIDTAAEREKVEPLTGYTPGPWYTGQPEEANGWWIISTDPEYFENLDASGDGGFYEPEARLIAAAPDLLATVHRLLDALDAMQRRIEGYWDETANLLDDRDQALAQVAAAYEVAAQDVEEWREEDGEASYDAIASSIRNLVSADAEDALKRVVDAAWNEAVEAAAQAAEDWFYDPENDYTTDTGLSREIRALKRPETSHEG